MGVYKVEETTKGKFVTNAVQVEMQRCHFYTLCHTTKAANVTIAFRAKHGIINIDMV
jgi:hypothetical protein